MIVFDNVTKKYTLGGETIFALRQVDARIPDEQFGVVAGASGSGKSTFLHMAGGLDVPDKGDVVVDDVNLGNLKDKKLAEYRNKKIGFVFQTFNLQPYYTAIENVALPLIFAGVSKAKREKKAKDILKAVGLGNRMKHKPGELSGGQRQRVSIARALVNDPEIVLADEPTGNLDSKTGSEIVTLLKDLSKKDKMTVIVVTHDLDIAKRADWLIKMKDGRVIN